MHIDIITVKIVLKKIYFFQQLQIMFPFYGIYSGYVYMHGHVCLLILFLFNFFKLKITDQKVF